MLKLFLPGARIHSDQGRDFESWLVKEMLTMLGVKKSHTSPYHPRHFGVPPEVKIESAHSASSSCL